MVTRRTFIQLALFGCLCLIPLTGQAQQIRGSSFVILKRDSLSTGFIRVTEISLDTTALKTWWPIDSLGSLIGGSTVREEIQYTGIANFSNPGGGTDSTVLQVWGQAYSGNILVYNVYLDRVHIGTAKPSRFGPSTWRDDLPPISTDSVIVYHIGRDGSRSAGDRGFISAYKVQAGTGLSPTVTTGTFYDMIRFDEVLYPTPGTSVQINAQLSVKKRR